MRNLKMDKNISSKKRILQKDQQKDRQKYIYRWIDRLKMQLSRKTEREKKKRYGNEQKERKN